MTDDLLFGLALATGSAEEPANRKSEIVNCQFPPRFDAPRTTGNPAGGWTTLVRFSHHLRTGLEVKTPDDRDFFYSVCGKELWQSEGRGWITFFDPNAHLRPLVEGRFFARRPFEPGCAAGPQWQDRKMVRSVPVRAYEGTPHGVTTSGACRCHRDNGRGREKTWLSTVVTIALTRAAMRLCGFGGCGRASRSCRGARTIPSGRARCMMSRASPAGTTGPSPPCPKATSG